MIAYDLINITDQYPCESVQSATWGVLYHPGRDRMIAYWRTWYDGDRTSFACVVYEDGTFGPITVQPTSSAEGWDLHYQIRFYAALDAFIMLGDIGDAYIIDVDGSDNVSITYTAVPAGGHVQYSAFGRGWALSPSGLMVVLDYNWSISVYQVSAVDGSISFVGLDKTNPAGLTGTHSYSHNAVAFDDNKFIWTCDNMGVGPEEDQVAMILTVNPSTGAASTGPIKILSPQNGYQFNTSAHDIGRGLYMFTWEHYIGALNGYREIVTVKPNGNSVELVSQVVNTVYYTWPNYVNIQPMGDGNVMYAAPYYYGTHAYVMALNPKDLPGSMIENYPIDMMPDITESYYNEYTPGVAVAFSQEWDRALAVAGMKIPRNYAGDPDYIPWLLQVGDVKPLFWTNFIGQTERK